MSLDSLKSSINLDEFEIVKTGNSSFPSTTATAAAGNYLSVEAVTTIFHGLGFTPLIFANVVTGTTNKPVTFYDANGSATSAYWFDNQMYADNNYLYLLTDAMVTGGVVGVGSVPCQYYLLKEKVKRVSGG